MKKWIGGIKKWIAVLLLSGLFLTDSLAAEKNDGTNIQLYARSAVLMDADSGRVLFGKNEGEILPMASTTKIMTCIIALENGNMDDLVSASSNAAKQPKVHLGMRSEQKFYLRDLMYSLMLESHNDSATAIAEHIGGSVEGFAALMNQKAKDIGCFDTFFITPNGLDSSGIDKEGNTRVHATTARDLARIMKYCVTESSKKNEFLEITRCSSYSFQDAEGQRSYAVNNHNAFLQMMDGALSGKTGFTNQAGYCYVGALERDGRSFVVALLACGWPNNRSYKWSDTKKLMNYGIDHYQYRDVFEPVEFAPIPVEGGIPAEKNPFNDCWVTVGLEEGADKNLSILLKDGEKVEKKIRIKNKMAAPVLKGASVGSVGYYLEDMLVREYAVVTKDEIEEMNLFWVLKYLCRVYLL